MKQHIWIYGKRLAAVLTGIACLCAAAGCSKTNEINDSAAVPANAPVSDSSADSGETPSDDSTADSTAEAGGDTSIHVVAVGTIWYSSACIRVHRHTPTTDKL